MEAIHPRDRHHSSAHAEPATRCRSRTTNMNEDPIVANITFVKRRRQQSAVAPKSNATDCQRVIISFVSLSFANQQGVVTNIP